MGAVEEMMCVMCVSITGGHSGDGCDLASTMCTYDLRKGDVFVLSRARVLETKYYNQHRHVLSFLLPVCFCGILSHLVTNKFSQSRRLFFFIASKFCAPATDTPTPKYWLIKIPINLTPPIHNPRLRQSQNFTTPPPPNH